MLAKIDNEVVGGVISEVLVHQIDEYMLNFYDKTFNARIKNNELFYAVAWWLAVKGNDKYLKKGIGTELWKAAIKNLIKEASNMGGKISYVFGEINPRNTDMINIVKKFNGRECLKNYISICKDGRFKKGLSLYCTPVSRSGAISRDDLLTMVEGIQIASNEFEPEDLIKMEPYLEMVQEILKKEYH